jgi:hypothetical protein
MKTSCLSIAKNRWMMTAVLSAVVTLPSLFAAPSLDVRKPPVFSSTNPNTGPGSLDPTSKRGQWFGPRYGTTPAPSVRSHEFHDNASGQGGSTIGATAINGHVTAITYVAGPGSNITGFQITAMIRNDSPFGSGTFQSGSNSHGEVRYSNTVYKGPLLRPVLVVEFAQTSPALFPTGPLTGTPYLPQIGARILATNHDLHAWYCFNNVAPAGEFWVPAWQLPDIPVGGLVARTLNFIVIDGGLLPSEHRYNVIVDSNRLQRDVLSNRTTSLKIGNWVERIFFDDGTPYPRGQESTVSVFHDAAITTTTSP